ncbi:MAG: hypothetical protein ABI843_04915 [Dokdonella sp.]
MNVRTGKAVFVGSTLLCCGLAGCVPSPTRAPPQARGAVQTKELPAPGSERYEHAANIDYIAALPYPENAVPAYPPGLLALGLPPIAVAVRLSIDVEGKVVDVSSIDPLSTQEQERFLAVVRQTCLRWGFSPLIQLDLDAGPTTVVEDGATVTYKGRPTPLPFHLDYQFVFSQQDGLPLVEGSANKP